MPSRGAIVLLFLAAAGVFGLFARGDLENGDTQITLHAAHAWWDRGDPGLVRADEPELLAEGARPPSVAEDFIARNWIDPDAGPDGAKPASLYGMVGTNGRSYIWFPIGHQALLAPFVGLGDWLESVYPEPAERFEQARGPAFGDLYWTRFLASFLSPACMAGIFVLFAWTFRRVGATPWTALLSATLAVFATQLGGGTAETMSNVPGALFLVGAIAAATAFVYGDGSGRALLWCGLASGAAVLVRYPQALLLLPFWTWVAVVAIRRGQLRRIGWLAAGGLPGLVLLLWANHARFGALTETGYTNNAGFGAYSFPLGFASILVAPGKGILWFSPLFVLAVWQLRRRSAWLGLTTCAALAFAIPLVLFSTVPYWAAGQCWGVRYLSAPLGFLTGLVLATTTPWQHAPRAFWTIATLGLLITSGAFVTDYTAQQRLATNAGRVWWGEQENLDNNVNWDPRLSPIHSHWTYAASVARGHLRTGTATEIAAFLVFGAKGAYDTQGMERIPPKWAGFRHLWWRALPQWAPGFPTGLVLGVWIAVTTLFGALAVWRWQRGAPAADPAVNGASRAGRPTAARRAS